MSNQKPGDLFEADRRKAPREESADRRLRKRPSAQLKTLGLLIALAVAAALSLIVWFFTR